MEHIYPFGSEPEACRCALWLKLWNDEPEVFVHEHVKLTPDDFNMVNDAKAVSKASAKVAQRQKQPHTELMNSTQQTTQPGAPKFMGISDEVLTCECCGKTNLKRTIMISLDGDSDPVHFGSDCAARTLNGKGYKLTGKQVEKHSQLVERLVREVAFVASQLARVHQMRNAGHVRYVIGGKEIGADLTMLDNQCTRELSVLRSQLEKAQGEVA